MNQLLRHLVVTAAACAIATPALAGNLVTNGSFEQATLSTSTTDKTSFHNNVSGWGGGRSLTFLNTPGEADGDLYLSVYGPFAATSPDGGNFVEMDGDPRYSSAITQTITGLVAGHHYAVTYYQAAGQQKGFNGATTERWDVKLGTQSKLSDKYSLVSHGVGPWEAQRAVFTATATSEVLSFLAVGTPNGKPPMSFLDGVSLQADVPEPATWAMMLAGFGVVGFALRRRATTVAVAA